MLSIDTSRLEKHFRARNYAYAEQLEFVANRQNELLSADFLTLTDTFGYDEGSKIFFETYNRVVPVDGSLVSKPRRTVKIYGFTQAPRYRCRH